MNKKLSALISLSLLLFVALPTLANHSWGSYHWGRTANPLHLNLGDNMSSSWDSYFAVAVSDWNQSTVLDLSIVAGNTRPKQCRPTAGMIQVCNASYGNNGWLGIAQIWASGNHITQGVTKMNDSYFNTATYNTPAWRQLVICQEIGHVFGLDHQDENFDNANLGTCMDYTNNPSSNQHPNSHDYNQLISIYSHLDSSNTAQNNGVMSGEFNTPREWGQVVRSQGRSAVYIRDFGNGHHMVTFVFWAE
jgi:hypothetical protein